MVLRRLLSLTFALWLPALAAARPVEFSFVLKPTAGNPFARAIWAEVATPDDRTLLLPAFYAQGDTWTVRARATAAGDYRLGAVTETTDTGRVARPARVADPAPITVTRPADPRGNIVVDPRNPRRFAHADGTPYFPLGANLAWPEGPRAPFYRESFARLREAGMNWSRVWMCHWGGTNLDWTEHDLAPSPAPGSLHPQVAAYWDDIVAAAEENDIHFQMVFQHHGQLSTGANANWEFNPWNAANGGFLRSPVAFFSDPQARALTKQKYRYIVARWGYSTAVMAWELFNEAMWTDARNGTAADNAAIASWHAEMADFVRSVDVYGHLVTTSDDYLHEPLYAKMDYLQPHLYASHLLPSARFIELPVSGPIRPVFYGEAGEDNEPRLVTGPRRGGALTLPIVWSSLMADHAAPAQYWYTTDAMRNGLLPQFATLVRFARAAGIDRRADLAAFTAVVESSEQMPLVIQPALNWRQGAGPAVAVPLDGREPAEVAAIPRHFVNADPASGQRYPGRVTLRLDYPRDATATVRIAGHGRDGASLRLALDGATVAEHRWPATADGQPDATAAEWKVPVSAGKHTLVLENPHGRDWFELAGIDTGLTCSPLAAVGRRAPDLLCLWLWHREGVYRPDGATPVAGQLLLPDVPAGSWRLTWWNLEGGEAQPTSELDHVGGTLRLPTPPIGRHGAVTLERLR